MAGHELSEKEQWNHFRTITYTVLNPQKDQTIAQQIEFGKISDTQWEDLVEIVSHSYYSPSLEDLTRTPRLQKNPNVSASQLNPDLKKRIRAKLQDRLERTMNLTQAAQEIQKSPENFKVIEIPQAAPEPTQEFSLFVFRVRGRRFAIPTHQVRMTGRLEAMSILSRTVSTSIGKIPLRDIKRTLGLSGEAGQVYIVTQQRHSPLMIAWAVDGLEGKKSWKKNPSESLPTIGASSASRALFKGMVREDSSPILVLDLDQMLSRATFRSL